MRTAALLVLLSLAMFGQAPPVKAGKYEVTLRPPADGLWAGEEMQIEYRVVDASKVDPLMGAAPVIRSQTKSRIDMPLMPSMAALVATAHAEGVPGEYGIHPVFPHGGEYRLTLQITPPGDTEFEVVFPLQIADASAVRGRKPKPAAYLAELQAQPKSPKAGEPANLQIVVRKREGNQVVRAFDVQHERLMHLIIVRSDLAVFAHEHPVLGADGSFSLTYTFPTPGDYHLFADSAPKEAGGQVLLLKLKVGGKKLPVPVARASLQVLFADANSTLPAGKTLRLPVSVTDGTSGKPVTNLEPYLGAQGHLILIHEDSVSFVHCHPDELDANSGRDGKIAFLARFPKAGKYKGWAQFQRGGKVETVEVTFQAK